VSALVLLHLTAVVMAALVASPPLSPLWMTLAEVFRPYVNAADLDHGYRFFAPDPGASHLVWYDLEFANGSKLHGKFPDLDQQRPRLLYHRYFMLSEHLYQAFGEWQDLLERSQAPMPPDARRLLAADARNAKRFYRALVKSYADELLRRTGAKRVTLELVEHRIPMPEELARGKRLDDSSFYVSKDKLGPFDDAQGPEELP
jgi:hypothetical protein